jgi:hypothetical protein
MAPRAQIIDKAASMICAVSSGAFLADLAVFRHFAANEADATHLESL